jgi:hypothetical protein
MLKDLFSNRLFIGALAIFVFCVGGSLLYMQHVERQVAKELAEMLEDIDQWNELQNQQPIVEAPVVEAPVVEAPQQDGHVHADGTFHAAPDESPVSEDAITAPPQRQYTKGSGNPLPFKNVPVDLSDFEATKAFMIESVNFVKANWDPKVFNLEVGLARVHIFNISSYADSMLCFYTPEQREEISALRFGSK